MPTPDTSSLALAERLGVHAAVATVVSARQLSPTLREVVLQGAGNLAGVAGNDVMVQVHDGQRHTRRRYSVRRVDAECDELTLWIATGHEGPGAQWARQVSPGDTVDLVGPRGKITLDPLADWHLFCGDAASLGAFYRMAEAIESPGKAIFIVEVDDMADAVTAPFDEGLGVTGIFVERQGRALSDPAGLLAGLSAFAFPEHVGHAYLFGEFHVNRALRVALLDRGLTSEQIVAKAYYRAGVANADHGEPAKD